MKMLYKLDLDFSEFYKRLCELLDEKGNLKDVTISHCIVRNIPSNYRTIEPAVRVTFLKMFTIMTTNDRFCGFKCTGNVAITYCQFIKSGSTKTDVLLTTETNVG